MAPRFSVDGYTIHRSCVEEEWLDRLASDFDKLTRDGYSVRGVLSRSFAAQEVATFLQDKASQQLGCAVSPTKATYFDKTPDANWTVPWHQDLTITVNERHEIDGFHHWRQKDGLWHVQPPISVLQNTIALRVHIDACPQENGPLRVIPGSHDDGVLTEEAIAQRVDATERIDLAVERGDVVAMAPLLLHSSLRARQPQHRRVLHLEYSSGALPVGLKWCG